MKKILILIMILIIYGCKGQEKDQSIEKVESKVNREGERVHWQDLPQHSSHSEKKESIGMRTEKNQQKLAKVWEGFWRTENIAHTKEFLTMEEIDVTNNLYYQSLKSQGFQFPSEEVFAHRIQEIFNVNIYDDHSKNPRIIRKGDFLILRMKVYLPKYHKVVPTLDFAYDCYIFDIKRRFLTSIEKANSFSDYDRDDYEELYYIYYYHSHDLALNDFIFYNRKSSFVKLNKPLVAQFEEDFGYEKFPEEYDYYYKDILRDKIEHYNRTSELTRKGWDYRMFDRLFFSRGFDGKLIVKKKMLAAAIELAQEDEDYIRVPLDYYFVQMTTDYIPNEYAAYLSEVDNYMKQLEPYYTPEERAMIWVYTALLELNLPPSETMPTPYMFIALAIQYPVLYKVAEEHNFFGEDMSLAFEYMSKSQFQF